MFVPFIRQGRDALSGIFFETRILVSKWFSCSPGGPPEGKFFAKQSITCYTLTLSRAIIDSGGGQNVTLREVPGRGCSS